MYSKIDLHMHSAASDGTDSPLQIAEKASALGICVFALTDHDTVEGAAFRRKKLGKRLAFLQEMQIVFPQDELERLYQIHSVGKPHLANLMVRYGYAANRQASFDRVLNRCHVKGGQIEAITAVKAVLASGGIPVWAHPMSGRGGKTRSTEQFEECWRS